MVTIKSKKEIEKMKEACKLTGFVYQEIEKLNSRDRKIMILRYGLYNQPEMTQKDVASLLDISQSYISRIEKKVIRRLRNMVKM